MKEWIALAAECYPRRWREQYGEEFRGLLDDVKPGWRVFVNVLRGAIRMQIIQGGGVWKLAAATAVAGAIVAVVASLAAPAKFVSSSVIQMGPQPDPERPASPEAMQARADAQFREMEEDILSQSTLSAMIIHPWFDLYQDERRRMPLQDITAQMRRDIHIEREQTAAASGGIAPTTIRISFAYSDRSKASAVVRELTTKFVEQNNTMYRNRTRQYSSFWRDVGRDVPPPPVGDRLVVVDLASLPRKSIGPNRALYLVCGLGGGFLVGLFAAMALRRRHGVLQLAAFAAAGAALACAVSLLMPNQYTSTVVMRVTPEQVAEDPAALPKFRPAAELLARLEPEILSRANLTSIIQDPRIDLYPRERANQPLEDVVRKMLDRDLRVAPLNLPGASGPASAFRISFTYPDRHKAQMVVRQLVMGFTELNVRQQRASVPTMNPIRRNLEEHKVGENLEVLDPASLPEVPVSPNRLTIAAIGLGAGVLLGLLSWMIRPHRATLQPA